MKFIGGDVPEINDQGSDAQSNSDPEVVNDVPATPYTPNEIEEFSGYSVSRDEETGAEIFVFLPDDQLDVVDNYDADEGDMLDISDLISLEDDDLQVMAVLRDESSETLLRVSTDKGESYTDIAVIQETSVGDTISMIVDDDNTIVNTIVM